MKALVASTVFLLAFLLICWLGELSEAKNLELRRSLSIADGRLPFNPYQAYNKYEYKTRFLDLSGIDKISDTTKCMVPQDKDPLIILFYIPDGGVNDYMKSYLKTHILSGALARSLQADFKEIAPLKFGFIVYRNGASTKYNCKKIGDHVKDIKKECHCPYASELSDGPPKNFNIDSWIDPSTSREGHNYLLNTIHHCGSSGFFPEKACFDTYVTRRHSQKIAVMLGDRSPGYIDNLDFIFRYPDEEASKMDNPNDYSITRFYAFLEYYLLGTTFLVTKDVLGDYIVLNNKLRRTVYSTVYEIEKYEPGVVIRDSLMGYLVRRMSSSTSRVGVYDSMDLIATLPVIPKKIFEQYNIGVTYILNLDAERLLLATDWDLSSCHNFMLNFATIVKRKYNAKLIVNTSKGFKRFESGNSELYKEICLDLQNNLLGFNNLNKVTAYHNQLDMKKILAEHSQPNNKPVFHIIIMHRFEWYYKGKLSVNVMKQLMKSPKHLTHIIWLNDKPFDQTKAKKYPQSNNLDLDVTHIETKIGAGNTLIKILETIDKQIEILGTFTAMKKYTRDVNEKVEMIDSVHFAFPHNPGIHLHGMMLSLLHNNAYLAKEAILNHFNAFAHITFSTYPSVEWLKANKADSKTCNFINSFGSLSETLNNVIPGGKPADAIWMGSSNCIRYIKGSRKVIFLFSETLPSGYGISDLEHDTFTDIGNVLTDKSTQMVAIVPHHLLNHWRKHIYAKIWISRRIYVHPFHQDDSIGTWIKAANKVWKTINKEEPCGKSRKTS